MLAINTALGSLAMSRTGNASTDFTYLPSNFTAFSSTFWSNAESSGFWYIVAFKSQLISKGFYVFFYSPQNRQKISAPLG